MANRLDMLKNLASNPAFEICVVGGGATGLGAALDAVSRGYRTIMLEQSDFAKSTSSRSTKLIHGGVRYLQQGNIKLVMEALRERGILKQNAPHLVKNQSFIVPNYRWWEGPYYGLGLKVYDWMSGSLGLGASEWLSTEEVLKHAPTLDPEGLRGGVMYHDGQFDDARLAIALAQTIVEHGGVALNYLKVTDFIKEEGAIAGVKAMDVLSGTSYEIHARVVINATGVFSDTLQRLDNPQKPLSISPSQGIHIVLDKEFLPGDSAIMIPNTDDGRVLFAVPWHNHIIVGTTDTPIQNISEEPQALDSEIDFLLEHASRYLTKNPTLSDVKSVFAGLRPLVRSAAKKTAEISRDHAVMVSDSGLVSIVGGKWTTYRKMAEDVVSTAAIHARLPYGDSETRELRLHGWEQHTEYADPLYYYGSDKKYIYEMWNTDSSLKTRLHPALPYTPAHILWAARNEFCMTLDDALSRRTRTLFLDARVALDIAPKVADLLAAELNQSDLWKQEQLKSFSATASKFLTHSPALKTVVHNPGKID